MKKKKIKKLVDKQVANRFYELMEFFGVPEGVPESETVCNEVDNPEDYKEGDIVYCTIYGKGTVVCNNSTDDEDGFPIEILTPQGDTEYYSGEGSFGEDHLTKTRTLFKHPTKIVKA